MTLAAAQDFVYHWGKVGDSSRFKTLHTIRFPESGIRLVGKDTSIAMRCITTNSGSSKDWYATSCLTVRNNQDSTATQARRQLRELLVMSAGLEHVLPAAMVLVRDSKNFYPMLPNGKKTCVEEFRVLLATPRAAYSLSNLHAGYGHIQLVPMPGEPHLVTLVEQHDDSTVVPQSRKYSSLEYLLLLPLGLLDGWAWGGEVRG